MLESCQTNTWCQEKWSRVWVSSLFQQHSWICKRTSVQRFFFSIKILFCLGPGKPDPQQLNHHFCRVPLELLARESQVHPSLPWVWACLLRINTINSYSPLWDHWASQNPNCSLVNKSVNCTARGTFTPCKITGLDIVSYLRNVMNLTSLTAL